MQPAASPPSFDLTERPPCAKCGARTTLARIEPGNDGDHDQRTFECTACGHEDMVTIKFKWARPR